MDTFLSYLAIDRHIAYLIVLAAIATYATRVGGYLFVDNLKTMPPRVEAALYAVPTAVLVTLVAPPFVNGDWDVRVAMVSALVIGLRLSGLAVILTGWAAVLIARQGFGIGI